MSRLSIADTGDTTNTLYDASVYQSSDPNLISATLARARAAETARRAHFEAHYERLRHRRDALLNSRLPVGLLPTELLQDIFQLAHRGAVHDTDWEVAGHRPMLIAMRLSHVCGVWRAAALEVPSLWATIIISDIRPKVDVVDLFLQRSRVRPLDIRFFLSQSVDAAVLISEHLDRWGMARMRLGNFSVLREMVGRLDRPMPHLETLYVLVTAIPNFAPKNISLQPSFSAPRLRVLALHNAPCLHTDDVSDSTFPHLGQLSLSKSTVDQYFSLVNEGETLGCLATAFPRLSALSLSGSRTMFEYENDLRPSLIAPYPTLESLTLETGTIDGILRSLSAPCLHTLTLVRLDAIADHSVPVKVAEHFPALQRLTVNAPKGRHFYGWLAPFIAHVRTIVFSDVDVNGLLQALRSVTFPRLVELSISFKGNFNYTTLRAALSAQSGSVRVVRGATGSEPREELRAWLAAHVDAFEWRQWRTRDSPNYVVLEME